MGVSQVGLLYIAMAESTPKRRPFQGGRRLPAQKKLFLASSRASPPLHVASEGWSSAENAALVEYVLFYGDPHVWPNYSSKDKIWEEAASLLTTDALVLLNEQVYI